MWEGQVLDVVKSAYEANKPAALAVIQSAEGGVETFIVNAIKNAPKPSGIVGMLLPVVENQLEATVTAYVAKNGPEVVYDFIDAELAAEAKRLGG